MDLGITERSHYGYISAFFDPTVALGTESACVKEFHFEMRSGYKFLQLTEQESELNTMKKNNFCSNRRYAV
jgi:hypothetical protein